MLLSVVIHLVPEPLLEGLVVGRAESVATGERIVIRDVDDLLAFLRTEADHAIGPAGRDHDPTDGAAAAAD